MAEFGETDVRVVKSDVDGWDVCREGEPQALSNHATREEAEEAARRHGGGDEVDVREEPLDSEGEDSIGVKRTASIFVMLSLAAFGILVVVSLIAALTDFGA